MGDNNRLCRGSPGCVAGYRITSQIQCRCAMDGAFSSTLQGIKTMSFVYKSTLFLVLGLGLGYVFFLFPIRHEEFPCYDMMCLELSSKPRSPLCQTIFLIPNDASEICFSYRSNRLREITISFRSQHSFADYLSHVNNQLSHYKLTNQGNDARKRETAVFQGTDTVFRQIDINKAGQHFEVLTY